MIILKKYPFFFTILFIFLFYLIDINNLNAIRQGTEGFYLQISKEMFESKSFLTPTYLGDNHWSKPPLHFWLAQPFYFITGSANLFSARISILLFSIFILVLIANWFYRHFYISKFKTLIFLCSSLGILKYSRIFMMESPLSYLSIASSLYFYNYLYDRNFKSILIASAFLSASILIKGPVSFVMVIGGIFFYLTYLYIYKKQNYYKELIIFSLISLSIGSIWFIRSYFVYGNDFIEYFFIRENLGKFSSKSYPVRHVFQGLIIYALPWSLFLFSFFQKNSRSIIFNLYKKQNKESDKYFFLLINFVFYFVLWMIPNQRSHHYAIPALPFFLLLTLAFIEKLKGHDKNFGKMTHYLLGPLFLVFTLILLLSLNFNEFYLEITNLLIIILGIIFSLFTSISYFRHVHFTKLLILSFLTISYIWIIITPQFILPKVPSEIAIYMRNKDIAASVHKPYFLEQAIKKEFKNVSPEKLKRYILDHPEKIFYIHESVYEEYKLREISTIVKRWPVWLRGRKAKDIFHALKDRDLNSLKEEIYLLKALKN